MQDLDALLAQLKKAGVTPSIHINLSPATLNIQTILDLQTELKKLGITPEIHIHLPATAIGGVPLTPQEPAAGQAGFTVVVSGPKLNCMTFTRRDSAGKPIMEIREPRVQLLQGARFSVSGVAKASDRDAGDGTIVGTGGVLYYLVTDCSANRSAEGLYVRQSDVARQ